MKIEYFKDRIEISCTDYPIKNSVFELMDERYLMYMGEELPGNCFINNNGCGDLAKVIIPKEYLKRFLRDWTRFYPKNPIDSFKIKVILNSK